MIARHWFDVIRGCGDKVRELMHDGFPTACVSGAAFAYVSVHKAHVNIGFFRGAALQSRLLEGSGRWMRHVKLTATSTIDEGAVAELIHAAYADVSATIAEARTTA